VEAALQQNVLVSDAALEQAVLRALVAGDGECGRVLRAHGWRLFAGKDEVHQAAHDHAAHRGAVGGSRRERREPRWRGQRQPPRHPLLRPPPVGRQGAFRSRPHSNTVPSCVSDCAVLGGQPTPVQARYLPARAVQDGREGEPCPDVRLVQIPMLEYGAPDYEQYGEVCGSEGPDGGEWAC